jgi:hypothetical protein
MSDHDPTQLDGYFNALSDAVEPQVFAPGAAAVRHTVRRRRRVATIGVAATALVLIAGPIAGYAALKRGPAPPPITTNQTATPTPTPTTVANLPQIPTSPPPPSTAPPAVDSHISREELLRAIVSIPAWQKSPAVSCPAKNVRLKDGDGGDINRAQLESITYGDADGDGATETITLLACHYGEAAHRQVVVFDRDAAGAILPGRQVAATVVFDRKATGEILPSSRFTPANGGFEAITAIEPATPAGVRVQVGDVQLCCAASQDSAQRQWRTYSWTGTTFAQTGGPRSFGPNPRLTDMAVTASPVAFTGAPGARRGTITITATNKGPGRPSYAVVYVRLPALEESGDDDRLVADGAGWTSCRKDVTVPYAYLACAIAAPAAGKHVTVTLGLRYTGATALPASGRVELWAQGADGNDVQDNVRGDNQASFTIS